jgi:serine/threonine protein kinase
VRDGKLYGLRYQLGLAAVEFLPRPRDLGCLKGTEEPKNLLSLALLCYRQVSMARSFCSYEELYDIVPKLTADSTTPVEAEELNPLIKRFLTKCHGSIKAIGGHSVLLSTSEGIAAKISFKAGDSRLRIEQQVFSLLEKSPSPHIVRCFLCRPNITFMPFISNRTLHDRIGMVNVICPIISWMLELSEAAATLEALGLAHGDIKPPNILVNEWDKLTLVDLDHTLPIGSDLEVGDEPYVRVHKPSEEGGGGVYGKAGPETEEFALGSIFWYITRGKELYAELDGFDRVNRLRRRQFPDLHLHNPIDNVIHNCWFGNFEQLADLLREIQGLAARHSSSNDIQEVGLMSGAEYFLNKELCNRYYFRLLEDEVVG